MPWTKKSKKSWKRTPVRKTYRKKSTTKRSRFTSRKKKYVAKKRMSYAAKGRFSSKLSSKRCSASKKSCKGDVEGARLLLTAGGSPVNAGVAAGLASAASDRSGQTMLRFTGPGYCPFPQRYFTRLIYSQSSLQVPSGGGYTNSFGYQSSAWDPDAAIGGNSANYFNQMGLNFLKYMVHGMAFRITFQTAPTGNSFNEYGGQKLWTWFTVVPYTSGNWSAFVPQTDNAFVEWAANKKVTYVGEVDSGKPIGRHYHHCLVKDLYSTKTLDPINFSGNTVNATMSQSGTNPAFMVYGGVTCFDATGGNAGNHVTAQIDVIFDIEFFAPMRVGPNFEDEDKPDKELGEDFTEMSLEEETPTVIYPKAASGASMSAGTGSAPSITLPTSGLRATRTATAPRSKAGSPMRG